MTLANCERLLKHYEDTGNLEAADAMRKRVAYKKTLPQYKKPSSSKK